MIFRVRYDTKGGHVHCRLFSAKRPNTTWMKCGEFTLRTDEFLECVEAMNGVEFLADEKDSE